MARPNSARCRNATMPHHGQFGQTLRSRPPPGEAALQVPPQRRAACTSRAVIRSPLQTPLAKEHSMHDLDLAQSRFEFGADESEADGMGLEFADTETSWATSTGAA